MIFLPTKSLQVSKFPTFHFITTFITVKNEAGYERTYIFAAL